MPIVDPFDSGPKGKPSPRVRQRDLQMRATEEDIKTAPLRRAQIGADLDKAPVDKARASVALNVDQRTADAQVKKAIADAERAELETLRFKYQKDFPELKEAQSVAAARAILMEEGNTLYEDAVSKGYEPSKLGNRVTNMLDGIPVVGRGMADLIRSPVAERAVLGQDVFTEGALRTVTGAAGPKEERPQTKIQYFPTPWQSDDPQLRNKLSALRRRQLETAKRIAGPALEKPKPSLPAGMTPESVLKQAKAAIASGKDRAGVIAKVKAMGLDPKGL